MFLSRNLDGLHDAIDTICIPDNFGILEYPMQLVLWRTCLCESACNVVLERSHITKQFVSSPTLEYVEKSPCISEPNFCVLVLQAFKQQLHVCFTV